MVKPFKPFEKGESSKSSGNSGKAGELTRTLAEAQKRNGSSRSEKDLTAQDQTSSDGYYRDRGYDVYWQRRERINRMQTKIHEFQEQLKIGIGHQTDDRINQMKYELQNLDGKMIKLKTFEMHTEIQTILNDQALLEDLEKSTVQKQIELYEVCRQRMPDHMYDVHIKEICDKQVNYVKDQMGKQLNHQVSSKELCSEIEHVQTTMKSLQSNLNSEQMRSPLVLQTYGLYAQYMRYLTNKNMLYLQKRQIEEYQECISRWNERHGDIQTRKLNIEPDIQQIREQMKTLQDLQSRGNEPYGSYLKERQKLVSQLEDFDKQLQEMQSKIYTVNPYKYQELEKQISKCENSINNINSEISTPEWQNMLNVYDSRDIHEQVDKLKPIESLMHKIQAEMKEIKKDKRRVKNRCYVINDVKEQIKIQNSYREEQENKLKFLESQIKNFKQSSARNIESKIDQKLLEICELQMSPMPKELCNPDSSASERMTPQQFYGYAVELKLRVQGFPQGKPIPEQLAAEIRQLDGYFREREIKWARNDATTLISAFIRDNIECMSEEQLLGLSPTYEEQAKKITQKLMDRLQQSQMEPERKREQVLDRAGSGVRDRRLNDRRRWRVQAKKMLKQIFSICVCVRPSVRE